MRTVNCRIRIEPEGQSQFSIVCSPCALHHSEACRQMFLRCRPADGTGKLTEMAAVVVLNTLKPRFINRSDEVIYNINKDELNTGSSAKVQ